MARCTSVWPASKAEARSSSATSCGASARAGSPPCARYASTRAASPSTTPADAHAHYLAPQGSLASTYLPSTDIRNDSRRQVSPSIRTYRAKPNRVMTNLRLNYFKFATRHIQKLFLMQNVAGDFRNIHETDTETTHLTTTICRSLSITQSIVSCRI